MPFAYYSRAATTQFWSEHWGGHSVEELLRVAQTSPLTSLLEQHLPRQGSILEAGCGLGQYVLLLRKRGYQAVPTGSLPPMSLWVSSSTIRKGPRSSSPRRRGY